MSKIRIDGHNIEASDEVIRNLLFGSHGSAQANETREENHVSKQEATKEEVDYQEPTSNPEPFVKRCKVCKTPLPSKRWVICGNSECKRKRRNNYVRKYRAKQKNPKTKHTKERLSNCSECGKPVPQGRLSTCSKPCGYARQIKKMRKLGKKSFQGYNVSPERKSYLSKCLTFVNKRGIGLAREFGISYEEGRKRAMLEWQANKEKFEKAKNSKLKPAPQAPMKQQFRVPDFPKFRDITPVGGETLVNLFMHLIANKGKLTYFEVKNSVQRSDDGWTGLRWHDFLDEVIFKSVDVLNYFSSKGKLKRILDTQGFEYLAYEGVAK